MIPCTPHPGLGTVLYANVATDLATCMHPSGQIVVLRQRQPTVVAKPRSQTILYKGKVVLTIHERRTSNGMLPGPISTEGVSPDGKWILYAIDPYGSASYPADGLTTRAVRITGGRSYVVSSGLAFGGDYSAWCGGGLVVTAGTNRIATTHKWLIATGPPDWKARQLVRDPGLAFGSLACDGNGVVVQEQAASTDANFFHTHWHLAHVGLDGSVTRLTSPPKGYADESPRLAGGVLYFVRSSHGYGKLYALQRGKIVGPLLSLGYMLGYYGHHDWPYTVTR